MAGPADRATSELGETAARLPPESLGRLFRRYLRFGLLAWGGPVAQIALIRQELVEEQRWVSPSHFNRVLAVYQVLPGPEAHEMCVYFGMLSRGRVGGLLAGLGFMSPGFVLMLALSALYAGGLASPLFTAFFLGVQPAVIALIVRAAHRIGAHAVQDPWRWALAVVVGLAHLANVSFWVTLPAAGAVYVLARRRRGLAAAAALAVLLVVVAGAVGRRTVVSVGIWPESGPAPTPVGASPGGVLDRAGGAIGTDRTTPARLFFSGLRSGLLTFGGAYTVLPFLRRDAVETGAWMTDREFLDGVALSGILPAPFIIFSTFVGYLGGGLTGALVLTAGIFLPAFGFTLAGHALLERLIARRGAHAFLDGVTAGVVGLIGATALVLFGQAVRSFAAAAIFGAALTLLYRWKARAAVAGVILGAGVVGVLVFR